MNVEIDSQPGDRALNLNKKRISAWQALRTGSLDRIRSVLGSALWFGLVTGLGEVILQAVRKFVLHRIIGLSLDLVWMAPLTDVLFFSVVGLILALIMVVFRKLNLLHTTILVFSSLSFFTLLLYTPLHIGAMLVLAVGLGVASANIAQRYSSLFLGVINRSFAIFVIIIIGLTIGELVWQGQTERKALNTLPPSPKGAPNVLVIVLDTVRAQDLSLYGYERLTTPRLDALAQKGVVFKNAYSTAPWTLPSHASMFTGRWHYELSSDWSTPLDDRFLTLAEFFRGIGYRTAGFIANNFYVNREHGLGRGFIHYEDFNRSIGQIFISSSLGQNLGCWHQLGLGCKLRPLIGDYELPGRKNAAEVNRDFLSWLSDRNQQPFFVFLNYFDAHAPYLPPEPFSKKFGPIRTPHSPVFVESIHGWDGSPQQLQVEQAAYDNAIAYLDDQIGQLIDELDRRGVLSNTLVIITSDHGEEFREHGVMSHGNSLYRSVLHIPLLILYPSHVPANIEISNPISLRNIPATVIDLAGLPNTAGFPGSSLAHYWQSQKVPGQDNTILAEVSQNVSRPKWYPVENGDMKSLILDDQQYIQNGDGSEEIYNLIDDPLEQHNLANTSEGKQALIQFRLLLNNIHSEIPIKLSSQP